MHILLRQVLWKEETSFISPFTTLQHSKPQIITDFTLLLYSSTLFHAVLDWSPDIGHQAKCMSCFCLDVISVFAPLSLLITFQQIVFLLPPQSPTCFQYFTNPLDFSCMILWLQARSSTKLGHQWSPGRLIDWTSLTESLSTLCYSSFYIKPFWSLHFSIAPSYLPQTIVLFILSNAFLKFTKFICDMAGSI